MPASSETTPIEPQGAGLVPSEPVIFEQSTPGACAVSLPALDVEPVDRTSVIPADRRASPV